MLSALIVGYVDFAELRQQLRALLAG